MNNNAWTLYSLVKNENYHDHLLALIAEHEAVFLVATAISGETKKILRDNNLENYSPHTEGIQGIVVYNPQHIAYDSLEYIEGQKPYVFLYNAMENAESAVRYFKNILHTECVLLK